MIQSPCIHVPSKRTEEVDWATPLKKYIASNYQDDPEKYLEEVNTINRLRQDMRGAGKDTTGRDLLYRYYGQLELLDLRFPVDENNIKISFTWCDTFTGKTTAQYSLAYEKACTIFNMASTLSAIASSQVRSEPEGLKRAFNYFQASAGMFTYINENFLHAPSTDLSRDIVKILSQLMLSQAQECFFEKSLGEKKKDALIAKLASQASWSYGSVVDAMNEGVAKTALSRWWHMVCQAKQKHYQAVAQYHKALACEAENKYGEVVARLAYAETNAKEATKLVNTFASAFTPSLTSIPPDAATTLQDITKSSQSIIAEKLVAATKDNDLVYHDTVPNVDVLQPIDKLNAVKPIPISELYGPNEIQKVIGVDIFQRLIPISVHESSSLYSEEKAKIIRKETEKVDLADGELDAALSFMQLPESLEKFKNRNSASGKSISSLAQCTQEVKEWARMISQEENERGMVGELIVTLEGLRGKAKELLDGVGISLEQEQRDCEAMRVKFGDLWTQAPSGILTTSFRQDMRTHREALDKAIASDRSLISRFEEIHASIDVLREGEHSDRLEQMFAEAVASAAGSGRDVNSAKESTLLDTDMEDGIESNIKSIEESIEKLNKIKKERQETLDDLKNKIQEDDISHLLILNKKSPNIESQLFATELEKFKGHQNRITATVHHQQAIIQELSSYFKALMEGTEAKRVQRIWDNAETRRDEVTNKLRIAANDYLDIKNGVRKGVQFYADLNDVLAGLNANARKLVHDREQERQSLVQSIEGSKVEREHQALKEQLEKYQDVPQGQRHFDNPPMNPAFANSAEANMYADMAIKKLTEQANRLHIQNDGNHNPYAPGPGGPAFNLPPPAQAPPAPNQGPARYNQSDYSGNSPAFSPPPPNPNINQGPICKTPSYGSDKDQKMYYPPPQNAQAPMARTPSYGSEADHHNPYFPPAGNPEHHQLGGNQSAPPMNPPHGPVVPPNMVPAGYQAAQSPYINQDPQFRAPRQPAPQHPHGNIHSPDVGEPRQLSPIIDRNMQAPMGGYQGQSAPEANYGQYGYGQAPYQQQPPPAQTSQPQNYGGNVGYGYTQQQAPSTDSLASPQANTPAWQPQQNFQKNLPQRPEYNPGHTQPVQQQQYSNQNPQPNQYPGYGGSSPAPAPGHQGIQRQLSNYDLQLKQPPQQQAPPMGPGGQPIRNPPPQQAPYQGFDNQAGQRPDQQQFYNPRPQQPQFNAGLQQQPQQQHARPNMYHEGSQNSIPQYPYGNGPSQGISSPYQPSNPATLSGGSDNSYVSASQAPPQQGYQQQQQAPYQQYHGQPQNQQPSQDPRLREGSLGQQPYPYQGGSAGQMGQQPTQNQQQPPPQQQQQDHNYPGYQQRLPQNYDVSTQQYQPPNPQQQFQTTPGPQGYQMQQGYNPTPPQGPSGYVNPSPQGWQQGTPQQQPMGNQYQSPTGIQGQQHPAPQQPQQQQQYQQQAGQWNGYPQQQAPPQGNFYGGQGGGSLLD